MKAKPMGMLLMMLAGWVNRHQQDVIVKTRVSLAQGFGLKYRGRCTTLALER